MSAKFDWSPKQTVNVMSIINGNLVIKVLFVLVMVLVLLTGFIDNGIVDVVLSFFAVSISLGIGLSLGRFGV
jgi:hypothetical protein